MLELQSQRENKGKREVTIKNGGGRNGGGGLNEQCRYQG